MVGEGCHLVTELQAHSMAARWPVGHVEPDHSAHSAWQYQGVLRSLSAEEFPPGYAARWGLWVNGLVALFGLALAGGLVYWRG